MGCIIRRCRRASASDGWCGRSRCRPRSGDALPLSARIFRRPAPAHRGRARDRAGADIRRARRADQRARHADPVADRRSAARPAEAPQPDLSVHLARPEGGGGAGEPPDRDAPRQGRRGGPGGGNVRATRRATIPARCSPPPSISRPRAEGVVRSSQSDRIDARGAILLAVTGLDPQAWIERFPRPCAAARYPACGRTVGDPADIAYACVWRRRTDCSPHSQSEGDLLSRRRRRSHCWPTRPCPTCRSCASSIPTSPCG